MIQSGRSSGFRKSTERHFESGNDLLYYDDYTDDPVRIW